MHALTTALLCVCRASCQIPYEELDIQDQIGGGGFSLVYRGLWKGTPVAIKKWFDPNATDEMMQEFREEVMTLQQLRHPNIMQFLGASMIPPNLCMVTEHLPHSLHSVLYSMQGELCCLAPSATPQGGLNPTPKPNPIFWCLM